ncbi:MAG: ABC transporter substrate-binding protein, partial [Dehalococcoidia bacterium]|nr:ABC transporter substrate-binding protein [Dehalococcoidia bacterium]
ADTSPITAFKTYTNDTFGLSASYPSDWEEQEGSAALGESLFSAQGSRGVPRMLVDIIYDDSLEPLAVRAKAVVDGYTRNNPSSSIISSAPLTLPSGDAAYEFVLDLDSTTLPLRGKTILVARGAALLQITVSSARSDYTIRSADFDRIARTFDVFEPRPFGAPRQQSLVTADSPATSLDPQQIGDAASSRYAAQIYSGLVALDRNLAVVPDLAERWDLLQNGTEYVFHLRRDVKFHGGKALTARDVQYTIERAADPQINSPITGIYLGDIVGFDDRKLGKTTTVTGVRVVNDFTISIRIKTAVPYFLAKLSHTAGLILNKENVDQGGQLWFLAPDGTGPYKVRGWDYGVVMVMERYAGYHRAKAQTPYIVIWNVAADPLIAYQAGDYDVARISSTSAVAVQNPAHPLSKQLRITPELSVYYVGFSPRRAPFDDPRARRAFALALDRDALIKQFHSDAVEKARGFLPLGMPGYTTALATIAYDPAQAKALWDAYVAEKRFTAASVDFLVAGQAVSPELTRMAEMWKLNLGVTVTFRRVLFGTVAQAFAQTGSIFEYGWVADYPDPENFLDVLFHSNVINNAGAYADAQLDILLESARTEQDPAKRLTLYRQADALLLQQAAAIPLYYGRNHDLIKPTVTGWFRSQQGTPDYASVSLTRTAI